jgi:hypothetical protein
MLAHMQLLHTWGWPHILTIDCYRHQHCLKPGDNIVGMFGTNRRALVTCYNLVTSSVSCTRHWPTFTWEKPLCCLLAICEEEAYRHSAIAVICEEETLISLLALSNVVSVRKKLL